MSRQSLEPSLAGREVGVFGFGITGRATYEFLRGKGSRVTIFDEKPTEASRAEMVAIQESGGAKVFAGDFQAEAFGDITLLIISPGISITHPKLDYLRHRGVEVISEVELAYRFVESTIVAVTGSNGKSTTAALMGHVLSAASKDDFPGSRAFTVGNIGTPFIGIAGVASSSDYVSIEVSSYQLEAMPTFRPHISIFTNLSADHLERHKTFETYAFIKRSLIKNQTEDDFVIFNGSDALLQPDKFPYTRPRFLPFTSERDAYIEEGAFVDDEKLVILLKGERYEFPTSMVKLRGMHNIENVLGAILAAKLLDISDETIAGAVGAFDRFEHRIEFIREIDGVRYYNDSKATNPESTITALSSFEEPIILILGGRDKMTSLTGLVDSVKRRAKAAILLGEATARFYEALTQGGYSAITKVGSLDDAVKSAKALASSGDIVLLSPACASFDMFRSFEHRGDEFKRIVNEMAGVESV